MFNLLDNLDFLTFGIATIGTGILGMAVYYNNKKSLTNKLFLIFSLVTILWSATNYASNYALTVFQSLLLVRGVMFFAVWQAFAFFLLLYVFPRSNIAISRHKLVLLFGSTIAVSLLTVSPLVFSRVIHYAYGTSPEVVTGPGIIAFALFSVSLVIFGLYSFFATITHTPKPERRPFIVMSIGMAITFALIVFLNFVLPTLFSNYTYISFGPLFTILFVVFTGYAIVKHKVFNIKVFSTEVFIFLILSISFLEFLNTRTMLEFALRFFIFFSLSLFSILLVRSVVLETKQKEEYSALAQSLEIANIRLQELDKQKTDFLSIAAHQLRTPLSIANGYIELLEDGAYGAVTAESKTILHNMDESNQRLVKLVDEFLDITRIEQGRVKFDFKPAQISEIIKSVVVEMKDRAKESNIKFIVSVSDMPAIVLDEDKIRHVVFNYIDNTIKYAVGKPVTISASEENGGISVRVRDEGVGFEKVDEVNFFQKFYRGNNVKGTNVNGTGLGLYVCRKFIEAHNGKVWAKSAGTGKGSEFGFWLPFHQIASV